PAAGGSRQGILEARSRACPGVRRERRGRVPGSDTRRDQDSLGWWARRPRGARLEERVRSHPRGGRQRSTRVARSALGRLRTSNQKGGGGGGARGRGGGREMTVPSGPKGSIRGRDGSP